ncbi:MAG: glycosyltransferase family 39 protein [Burkholderiales bacterium]|nr:glycosyltransferase family 39 protein [Anaerolineae bacterium]
MLLILLLALGLQAERFRERPFRQDEAWSVDAAATYDLAGVVMWVSNDIHTPLYSMLLHGWVGLVGTSEMAARWLSFLLSALTIALVYRSGRDLFSTRAGIYAALLLVASDFFMFFGGETRPYPLLATLAALLLWLYVRWLKTIAFQNRSLALPASGEGIRRSGLLLAFTLIGAALIYTHIYGAYLIAALALYTVVFIPDRRSILTIALACVGMGVLFIPWLPALLRQLRDIYPVGRDSIWGQTRYDFAYVYDEVMTLELVSAGLLALSVIAALFWPRRATGQSPLQHFRFRQWRVGLVAFALIIPVIIAYVVAGTERPITGRNFFIIMPALALALAYGLSRLPKWIGHAAIVAYTVAGISVYAPLAITENYPAITADMHANLSPGEPLLIDMGPDIWHYIPFAFYFQQAGILNDDMIAMSEHWPLELARLQVHPLPTLDTHDLVVEAQNIIDGQARFTVVGWYTHPFRDNLLSALRANYAEVRREEYGSIIVSEYAQAPQSEPRIVFGDMFALTAWEIPPQAAACQPFSVTTWWKTVDPPDNNYSLGLYLVDDDGVVVAQSDGAPANSLTLQWTPMLPYADVRVLQAPCESGDYTLRAAVYDPATVTNLSAADAEGESLDNPATLGYIAVQP